MRVGLIVAFACFCSACWDAHLDPAGQGAASATQAGAAAPPARQPPPGTSSSIPERCSGLILPPPEVPRCPTHALDAAGSGCKGYPEVLCNADIAQAIALVCAVSNRRGHVLVCNSCGGVTVRTPPGTVGELQVDFDATEKLVGFELMTTRPAPLDGLSCEEMGGQRFGVDCRAIEDFTQHVSPCR